MCPPEPDRKDSLQAKKQEVVRQEIWSAAISLFGEHGFDEVTVEQIALRAGISRRTFFRYFSSKEDVMASVVKRYGAALTAAVLAEKVHVKGLGAAKVAVEHSWRPEPGTTEHLESIVNRSLAARMAMFLQVPILEQELAEAFATKDKRKGKPTLEHRLLATLTLSASGLCTELWVAQPSRPLQEIVDQVFGAASKLCGSAVTPSR